MMRDADVRNFYIRNVIFNYIYIILNYIYSFSCIHHVIFVTLYYI